jgi:hypothetical protein
MRLSNLKSSFAALAFGLCLITRNAAFDAEAYTASDLDVRTGPGTQYDRAAHGDLHQSRALLPPASPAPAQEVQDRAGFCLPEVEGD